MPHPPNSLFVLLTPRLGRIGRPRGRLALVGSFLSALLLPSVALPDVFIVILLILFRARGLRHE